MEQDKTNSGMSYFRIKTEWVSERDNGMLEKIKTEELVLASCYSEAEQVAYAISENNKRGNYGNVSFEIIKTKIADILYSDILSMGITLSNGLVENYFEENEDSGVGLYAVKIINFFVDEKTGKVKRSPSTIYLPAVSNSDAASNVTKYMKNSMSDYVIRDIKFDKAEAIYWPQETFKSKMLNPYI